MSGRRRNRGLELGVVLLASEIMNVGVSTIPPVTLITLLGQVALYLGLINTPWDRWDVCISAEKIFNGRNYRSLILSALEHADDMHLYYNMISYMIKGRSLERRYGSTNFAFFLTIITLMTSTIYVGLARLGVALLDDPYYWKVCAIGFSGVIFALKVVTSCEQPFKRTSVAGINMSVQYAAWAELILIHLLVPQASFIGHLAGILAGALYCYTPLGTCIDSLISSITGEVILHDPSFTRRNPYPYNEDYQYFG